MSVGFEAGVAEPVHDEPMQLLAVALEIGSLVLRFALTVQGD